MKHFVYLATIIAAFAAISVQAQTSDLRADIPFEFRMGNAVMPAGEYRILQDANGVLKLRTESGNRTAALVITNSTIRPESQRKGYLEFNRYGETYFLSKVWKPNSTDGRILSKSTREKELVSHASQTGTSLVSYRTK